MKARAAFGVVLALVAACSRYGNIDRSKGFTGKPASATVEEIPVKGFEVDIAYGARSIQGELLAIDDTYLYVLSEGRAQAVQRRQVKTVSIELYPSYAGGAAAWTSLGTLSTVTHGWFLVFSAPIWLGVGISMSAAAGATNDLDVDADQLGPLYQYARFPQGLPPGWPREGAHETSAADASATATVGTDADAWDASPE